VLRRMTTFQADSARIAVLKAKMAKEWRNQVLDRPSSQAGGSLIDLLRVDEREERSLVDLLDAVSPADVDAALARALASSSGRLFTHGNLTRADADALAEVAGKHLTFTTTEPVLYSLRSVPRGADVVRDLGLKHNDSALLMAYVSDAATDDERAGWELLSAVLRTPFFTRLRTEEQLGYVVNASIRRFDLWSGLQIVIQSSSASPVVLQERVDVFLRDFDAVIAAMSPEELAAAKQGVVARLLEADTQLLDRTDTLAGDLRRGRVTFDGDEAVAAKVEALDHAALLAFYRDRVLNDPGRVVLRSVGLKHDAAGMKPGCASLACAVKAMGPTRARAIR
jgi:insulysin